MAALSTQAFIRGLQDCLGPISRSAQCRPHPRPRPRRGKARRPEATPLALDPLVEAPRLAPGPHRAPVPRPEKAQPPRLPPLLHLRLHLSGIVQRRKFVQRLRLSRPAGEDSCSSRHRLTSAQARLSRRFPRPRRPTSANARATRSSAWPMPLINTARPSRWSRRVCRSHSGTKVAAEAAHGVRVARTKAEAVRALEHAITVVHKDISLVLSEDVEMETSKRRSGEYVADTLKVASVALVNSGGL